jgi:hypothetical protein
MSYAIRLFATVPFRTLNAVQAHLLRQGLTVTPVGTNQLDISLGATLALTLDLIDATNPTTQQDVIAFIDRVSRLPDSEFKEFVLSTLAHTQAIAVIGVPEHLRDADQDILNRVIDAVAADGLFHVEGEGFYNGSTLILRI